MKIVTYGKPGRWKNGILIGDKVVDFAELAVMAEWSCEECQLASSNKSLLTLGLDKIRELEGFMLENLKSLNDKGAVFDLHKLRLGPPIPDPNKIICTGLNYVDHAKEVGMDIPTVPLFFPKYSNSLIGPIDDIVPPFETQKVDYEAELAIVIGKRGRYINEFDALNYVAGAMVFNDVSARDLQLETQTWTSGKAIDTFGPCGPALVTKEEINNFQNLAIKTKVDGQTVQNSNTSQMVFPVVYLVSYLSKFMTLEPGDIISTGTPAGVGTSFNPPLYLKTGSKVEVSIEKLGKITNTVVEARDFTFEVDDK